MVNIFYYLGWIIFIFLVQVATRFDIILK